MLLALAMGFFLGGAEIFPGVYPMGGALVSVLPKNGFMALVGIFLRCLYEATFGNGIFLCAVCAAAILALRTLLCFAVYGRELLLRAGHLPDTLFTKLVLCVSLSLCFALLENIRGGEGAIGAAGLLLLAVCSAAFSFLYCFFFGVEYRELPAFEIGLCAVVFSIALSLRPFAIGDFSMGLVASFAITLYIGFFGSPTRSSAVGLLCGLALGGWYAPILALAGLAAGIFAEVNTVLSAAGAVLVAACAALYFTSWEGVLALLPEILFSAFSVTLLVLLGLVRTDLRRTVGEREAVADLLVRRRDEERKRRMNGISASMNALSGVVRGFSERFRRPTPEKLTERCREIWRTHCKKCPNQCTCRGLVELESDRVSDKLASRLMSRGRIDRERLYEITKARCPDLDAIAAEISACSAQMLEEAIREDKTRVFAMEYEAMAQMFADAAAEGDMRLTVDRILSDRLRRAFLREGVRAENVIVCGDRKKFVIATGEEVAHTTLAPSVLHGICEQVCGVRFGEPVFMIEKGCGALTLESLPVFEAESEVRQLTKHGERVCGDSVACVRNYDGFYYNFICDGMGSGEDAALTSQLCRIFLEKMLACGNKKATTLEMLNHFLSSRTTESFTTVDLVEIDLFQGVASFLKSGAVPSYVIRNGNLYKISSGTFPIGILPEVSVEVTEFELCDADVILLCSDGIASEIESHEEKEPTWFADLIAREWTQDLAALSAGIIGAMRTPPEDDATVSLVRIRRADAEREDRSAVYDFRSISK